MRKFLFPFSRILPHTRAHQFPRHGRVARDAVGRASFIRRAKPLRLRIGLVALVLQMRQLADILFHIVIPHVSQSIIAESAARRQKRALTAAHTPNPQCHYSAPWRAAEAESVPAARQRGESPRRESSESR